MRTILTFIAAVLAVPAANAEEPPAYEVPSFTYMGYISQSWVKTSANNVGGNSSSKWGSLDKREIGMLASYSVNDNLDVRGMASYERYGEQIDRFKVNYALADLHDSSETGRVTYGARVGRIKLGMGTMNDTRENPVLRDLDFAPQGLYRDQFRDMATMGDGAQLYVSHAFDNGKLFTVEYGQVRPIISSDDQDDVVNVLFNIPQNSGKIDNSDSKIKTLSLQYAVPASGWIFRYDRVSMDYSYVANPASIYSRFVPSGQMETTVNYYSARKYFMNGVDITGEVIKVDRRKPLWDKVLEGRGYGDPYAFSVLVRYKPDERWTLYGNYNAWYTDINDRSGEKHGSIPGNAPASRYRYQDFNVGFKYNSRDHWIYRMSFHAIRGTNTLSLDDNPSMISQKDRYNMVTASITYAF
jgi:hypothetical protein